MNKPVCLMAVIVLLMAGGQAFATEGDSTKVIPDTLSAELLVDDSANAIPVSGTIEQRLGKFKQEQPRRLPELSMYDSLTVYFAPRRLNLSNNIDRSFFSNAGHYLRSDPSFFILSQQVTPMRTTVQPYGLSGDRTTYIIGQQSHQTFEHVLEPDGMVDMNDLPTAFDSDIYALPGPMIRLFGGQYGVAGLLAIKRKPETNEPNITLKVDKGSFVYNHTRSTYSRRFETGKTIDFAVEYRNADGITSGRVDDIYHYTSDIYLPVGQNNGFAIRGNLYDREGDLSVKRDSVGSILSRSRIERNLSASWDLHNEAHSTRLEIGYTHQRHGSDLRAILYPLYWRKLNQTGNRVFAKMEKSAGQFMLQTEANGGYLEYDDQSDKIRRYDGNWRTTILRHSGRWSHGLAIDLTKTEGFDLMVGASLTSLRQNDNLLMVASIGYAERAPHLYELHLARRIGAIYGQGEINYVDQGNPGLNNERQLVGNLTLNIGSDRRNITFDVTGGKIKDGIDWRMTTEGSQSVFSPYNGDIDFVNISAKPLIAFGDYMVYTGGAAWRDVSADWTNELAYTTNFQTFSGLELHYYWASKLVHLRAYGEAVYNHDFRSHRTDSLGREIVTNMKLTFNLKRFSFHWIIQNALSNVYVEREGFEYPGRYSSFGFEWSFLN